MKLSLAVRRKTHAARGLLKLNLNILSFFVIIYLIVKTFNNGSLGSRIDEERSEMRYVIWIADIRESSNLWTHIAPSGIPEGMPVWASFLPQTLGFGVEQYAIRFVWNIVMYRRKRLRSNQKRFLWVLMLFQHLTSNQVGLPAELKHINKRRKRNQQGLP